MLWCFPGPFSGPVALARGLLKAPTFFLTGSRFRPPDGVFQRAQAEWQGPSLTGDGHVKESKPAFIDHFSKDGRVLLALCFASYLTEIKHARIVLESPSRNAAR